MEHDDLKDLLPLKAVDKLDSEEEAQLLEHLAQCRECRGELREFEKTLAALAIAGTNQGSGVDTTWPLLEERLSHSRPNQVPNQFAAESSSANPGKPPATYQRWFQWSPQASLGAAAAIGALLVLVGAIALDRSARIATLEGELRQVRSEVGGLQQKVESAQNTVASLGGELGLHGQLTRVLVAPDLRFIKLKPLPPAPEASGLIALTYSRDGGRAFLQTRGLPPTPAGQAYQLWWIGERIGTLSVAKAALFPVGTGGVASVAVASPPAATRLVGALLTLEPAGGSDKPREPAFMRGDPGS